MKNKKKNKNIKNLPSIIISTCFILSLVFVSFYSENNKSVEPVSAATFTGMAQLIGGITEGTGSTVCCNGITLEFDSKTPGNPWILDGDEAINTPKITKTFEGHNESDEGYCSVGKLFPFVCLDPGEECYSGEMMPLILTVGTSPVECSVATNLEPLNGDGFLASNKNSGELVYKSVPFGGLAEGSGFGSFNLFGSGDSDSGGDPVLDLLSNDPVFKNHPLVKLLSGEDVTGTKVKLFKSENEDCEEKEEDDDDNDRDEDCETDEEHNDSYWSESHEFLQSIFGEGSGENGAFVPEDFQAGGAADPWVRLTNQDEEDK